MSCWQFSMTHCHHCISIIVLYQVLLGSPSLPAWKLSQQMFLLVVRVFWTTWLWVDRVVRADNKVLTSDFLLAINKCSPLLTTIIDTIYLAKLFLIDNLSCFIVGVSLSQLSVPVINISNWCDGVGISGNVFLEMFMWPLTTDQS